MSAEALFRESEKAALGKEPFKVQVMGRNAPKKRRWSSISATGFLMLMIVLIVILFGAGNLMPMALSERLLEETDMQYADLVESKKLVLQQALRNGEIPDDTAALLKQNGVLVGYVEGGDFVENNKAGRELALKKGDEVITADNFIQKVNTDAVLYNAITFATYDRAAAYYDEAAKEVFKKVGTRRNNFSNNEDFATTMNRMMGTGSQIDVSSVLIAQNTTKNADGSETTTYDYDENGEAASSKQTAADFVEAVRQKNPAADAETSALNAADSLKVADTITKEQRSSLFYALFMENISKMMAGDGNESKINEVMNFLTSSKETEVIDTKTGEKVKVVGSPLESPSLYAILTGNKADNAAVENYSSERVLKTVRNKIAAQNGYSPTSSTIASSDDTTRGSIGRLLDNGEVIVDAEVLQTVQPTIESSLVENSYESIKGISAGEFLAEGAVNLSKQLAKTSGATAGDGEAARAYARVTEKVLAMEAEADRVKRSPFDITSKNTFLGSIMYNFAIVSLKNREISGMMGGVVNLMGVLKNAVIGILPSSLAADEAGYLTSFGECETIGSIGAVGTAGCAEIVTFDVSTLNDPFNNPEFVEFVNNNTVFNSAGIRTIKPDSVLADFIIYNNERKTPLGVVDGGILEALNNDEGEIPFVSNILEMVQKFLGASEQDKQIASGRAFVNAADNQDWQTYKYAQRYVSLARATAMLKEHSNDQTAYQNLEFFEGEQNPVMAFLEQYYQVAENR